MPVKFNMRHLENQALTLADELPVEELELEGLDELVALREPVEYEIEVERAGAAVLARGRLAVVMHCQCARCLREFEHVVDIKDWACDLPLDGEDKVEILNDCVDLTPFIREDILLAFPQHPLCDPECGGLKQGLPSHPQSAGADNALSSSNWDELNKLDL